MTNAELSEIEELGKVWTPEANWGVPTIRGKAPFVFPAFGPNTYDKVVEQVLANKQRLPTGEQNAFMLDRAYNSDKLGVKDSKRTEFVRKDIMYNGWLWVPVVNVWTPVSDKNAGLYTIHDEKGLGLSRKYTKKELEDMLGGGSTERGVRFSKDRKVAFASGNLITGFGGKNERYHEKGTLHNEGAFMASYDIEGAEKLDNVGKVFAFKPRSWIVVNKTDKLIHSLSALSRGRLIDANRLYAYFYVDGYGGDGYVLPVSGSGISAEGTAKN